MPSKIKPISKSLPSMLLCAIIQMILPRRTVSGHLRHHIYWTCAWLLNLISFKFLKSINNYFFVSAFSHELIFSALIPFAQANFRFSHLNLVRLKLRMVHRFTRKWYFFALVYDWGLRDSFYVFRAELGLISSSSVESGPVSIIQMGRCGRSLNLYLIRNVALLILSIVDERLLVSSVLDFLRI